MSQNTCPDRRVPGWSLLLAVCLAPWPAHGADELDAVDPLSLESAPAPEVPASPGARWFVEGAAGRALGRPGIDDRGVGRLSLDGRLSGKPISTLQGTLSARLDATDPKDARFDDAVFSLREAFVSWQDRDAGRVFEFGRINLREGPAYAYNPTDFLRAGALRTVTAVDPSTLRENRLGTVMFRAQQLWTGGSLAVAFAPRLERRASDQGLAIDLGATNASEKLLGTVGWRASEAITVQGLAFRQAGQPWQLGASVSALLSPSLVAHLEWSGGRGIDLLARATGSAENGAYRQRWVAGIGYTTATRLSITTEVHYNGRALDHDAWQNLRATSPELVGPYVGTALLQQDNASRHAWFVHVIQRDLGTKGLDLSGLLKLNQSDGSKLAWLELKYRLAQSDIAAQVQRLNGPELSEFGLSPYETTLGAVWTVYF